MVEKGREKMNLNLCLLEYIVEVAKCGSISKAAQNLFVSQPHLSNQIKGMENQLNVRLFRRSAKGMDLTEEGKIFVEEAQSILKKAQALETHFQMQPDKSVKSYVSMTRSYQLSLCVARFINEYINKDSFMLHIKETNPFQVIEDVYSREAELGILHFFDAQKDYFLNSFRSHNLKYEKHYERKFLIATSKDGELAKMEHIDRNILKKYVAVIYGDYEIPSASYETITKFSDIVLPYKRVYVYDRASAMEILQHAPNTYMWITGLHSDTIKQYQLKLRECSDVNVTDLGYLVYASDKKLSWSTEKLLDKMLQVDWTEDIS